MAERDYPEKGCDRILTDLLMRFGVGKTVALLTVCIATLSLVLTCLCLTLFQGYIDFLGIALSVGAPSVIFPGPAIYFFTIFERLQRTRNVLHYKNRKLEDALTKVKTLSGLLPMCCSCKKIRDDEGDWRELEQYLCDHSNAQLTHGFCPDCVARLYPELDEPSVQAN